MKKVPIHLQSAQSRLLIKGGRVVNDDQSFIADIYVEDGVIKQIGTNLVVPGGARTIEAKGRLIMPGGIDVNTHFQQPFGNTASIDDFYSGTKAALAGGTTMIIDCVIPDAGKSLVDAYNKWRELADAKACCDYALHVCVPSWNDKVADEMDVLAKEKGVNSFHAYMSNKDQCMLKDADLYRFFRQCKQLNVVPLVHAENGSLIEEKAKEIFAMGITGPEGHLLSRPEEVETEAVYRAITLASQANAPVYITKVMSRSAADVVADSRRAGKVVFGEVIPAALTTDGSHYYNKCWRHAAGHVTSPPLRVDPLTSDHLVDLLANGDLQLTASDHCTFSAEQKAAGRDDFRKIPSGLNGVEERMSVLWEKGVATGKMDACRFVAVTSTQAAKVFNLYPKKGRIAVGSDADIVIWDPSATRTISTKTQNQKCDFNVFEGLTCRGVPWCVISAGCVILDEDGLRVTQGVGQFVPAPCGSEFVFGRLWEREKACNKPQKVQRDPYTGPAMTVDMPSSTDTAKESNGSSSDRASDDSFHNRPPTRSGGRNMQDSTFAFSGAQIDDSQPQRTTSRVIQPPGGKSTSLW